MKYLVITALLLLQVNVSLKIYSQELNLTLESGLGSYKMNDLRDLNDVILNSLPFDAKVTGEFPMYWYYKPSLVCRFSKTLAAGLVWSYSSTGSRIASKDYSGEYTLDNMIRASSPGVLFEFIHPFGKFELTVSGEAGMEFTKLKLKESVTLSTESQENLYTFNSINYYVEPGVRISYHVSKFRFSLHAGYLFDLMKGDFSYEGTDNLILRISEQKEARADWTGFRIGLSASYMLFRKKSF